MEGIFRRKFSLNYKRLQEFVPAKYKPLHTSGHADAEAIKEVINIVKPRVIIPIHGENPEAFETMNISNCEIEILHDNEEYYI